MSEEIHYSIGRLEVKLDMLMQQVHGQRAEDIKDRRDIESRITKLEEWRWKIVGVTAVISTAAGFLIPKLLA